MSKEDIVTDMEIKEESDSDSEDEEIKEEGEKPKATSSNKALFPSDPRSSHMKNKIARRIVYSKEKSEKRKARLAKKKQKNGEEKKVPKTLEQLRLKDDTTIGNIADPENELLRDELECDEFSSYFRHEYEPKILITYSDNPNRKTRIFGRELTRVIPNSVSLLRKRSSVKKIIKSSLREGYTDILIINENHKQPNGLLAIHLPDGPTAHFKLSNVKITPELRKNWKQITAHKPEVILTNFSTRLGLTVGRMFASWFHHKPDFHGRRVVSFVNQRDYIFFRHHKYTFVDTSERPRTQELGPRFTLKLRSLQKGTFDSKSGNYIWIIDGKRHEVQSNRRKFFL